MRFNFEERVAVITGAGRGLGREYALLLASRGAKVVVNDFSKDAAESVVAEIRNTKGQAIANFESVENGGKVIKSAIDAWGKIDILICNAGNLRDRSFQKMTEEEWNQVINVHLLGTFSCCKAAWPLMVKQRYGRIIFTSSGTGLYGNFGQANYSAAKSAMIGFAKTLAQEGDAVNIKVNAIAPTAGTRMTEKIMPKEVFDQLSPRNIAPLVTVLVHETCPSNGAVYECGGRYIGQVRHERAKGVVLKQDFTAEDVAAAMGTITDFSTKENTYPASLQDSIQSIVTALEQPQQVATQERGGSSDVDDRAGKAAKIFALMGAYMERFDSASGMTNGKRLADRAKATFGWIIKLDTGEQREWTIDLEKEGRVHEGLKGTPSVIFETAEADFVKICLGSTTAQAAYMRRRLKIKGSVATANKFRPNLFPKINEAVLALPTSKAIEFYMAQAKL